MLFFHTLLFSSIIFHSSFVLFSFSMEHVCGSNQCRAWKEVGCAKLSRVDPLCHICFGPSLPPCSGGGNCKKLPRPSLLLILLGGAAFLSLLWVVLVPRKKSSNPKDIGRKTTHGGRQAAPPNKKDGTHCPTRRRRRQAPPTRRRRKMDKPHQFSAPE